MGQREDGLPGRTGGHLHLEWLNCELGISRKQGFVTKVDGLVSPQIEGNVQY